MERGKCDGTEEVASAACDRQGGNYQTLFGLLIAPESAAFLTSSSVERPRGAEPPHSNRVAAGVQ